MSGPNHRLTERMTRDGEARNIGPADRAGLMALADFVLTTDEHPPVRVSLR